MVNSPEPQARNAHAGPPKCVNFRSKRSTRSSPQPTHLLLMQAMPVRATRDQADEPHRQGTQIPPVSTTHASIPYHLSQTEQKNACLALHPVQRQSHLRIRRSLNPTQDLLSLHRVAPALTRRGGKEPYIDVVVLHQLGERWHDVLLYELLALSAAAEISAAHFLHARERRGFVRHALEDVDENGVGFGHVEADVGDGVFDELAKDGNDGASEHGDGKGGCKSLRDVLFK